MKKILFLLYTCLIMPILALDLEQVILVNKYAEEMDLTENTLWFEFMKNGNYCVMYNSSEDLAGFQFNFKDLKQTYNDNSIVFRGGQTKKNGFTLKYNEKNNLILGFSLEGKTLPAGIDTLFEITVEKQIDSYKEADISEELEEALSIQKTLKDSEKGCELPSNTLSISGNSIIYNSKDDIGGFQFNLQDALISQASGGDAEKSGFTTSFGKNVVLSFSFEGDVIPSGCGILLTFESDQAPSGIDNIVISSIKGEPLNFRYIKD